MPRQADPTLPSRVVDAAYVLAQGRRGGRHHPRRGAPRQDHDAQRYALRGSRGDPARRALLARSHFLATMAKSTSLPDGFARLLAFADEHPRDYELLFGYGFRDRAEQEVQAAEFAVFEDRIRQAGVRENDVRPTALAIRNLLHGTAMFRLAQERPGPWWPESRSACLDACAALLERRRQPP
jgi:hypothetical protein